MLTLPSYERLSALSREAVSAALAVDFDLRAFCAGAVIGGVPAATRRTRARAGARAR